MHTMKELLKPKVAVIGCGYWGKNIIRTLDDIGNLFGVCDFDSELAQNFSKQFSVNCLTISDIKSSGDIDAVCIATPAETHKDLALDLLDSNKSLFIEKPLATSLEDAKEIYSYSLNKDIVVQVGHLLRYHPAFVKTLDLVKEGIVGNIVHIHSTRKSFGKTRNNENVIWSFAPHDISMILEIANEMPKQISCVKESKLKNGIDDIAEIFLRFSDYSAKISVSWLNPNKEHNLIIVGDKATIIFDDTKDWSEKISIIDNRINTTGNNLEIEKGETSFIEIDEAQPLKKELEHFVDCVKTKKSPTTDCVESLRVLEVMSKL